MCLSRLVAVADRGTSHGTNFESRLKCLGIEQKH